MIAHARHDEKGKISGGISGDQTGEEVTITEWYNRPWNVVLRHPDETIREKIAAAAEAAAKNDHIGYDQAGRDSLYIEAGKVGFDLSKITTDCETDCSELVAVCCIAAGLTKVDPYLYTVTERVILSRNGFTQLTGTEYVASQAKLLRGDILLYEGHHTAINLTTGPKYKIGWNRDDKGWWYADTETTYLKSCWRDINGHRYHFDGAGYMETGLHTIDGDMYYFLEKPDDICGGLCVTWPTGKLTRMEVKSNEKGEKNK